MLAGAFSSTSGKADTTMTTNGDILYYNSGRQRLAIGTEGKVLTVSDADLPAWETASGGWVATATSVLAMSQYQINYGDEESSTITGGSLALDGMLYQKADTEGSASTDDLRTLTGVENNSLLVLGANNDGRTVVVIDWYDNIITAGDFSLSSSHDRITFQVNSAGVAVELSRSDNLA